VLGLKRERERERERERGGENPCNFCCKHADASIFGHTIFPCKL